MMHQLLKKDSFNIPLLIITGALLFIPFLGRVHLFDWDEANFAEAAREMIVTHDYTRVTIDYQPFWEKPPLFIWLEAISMNVFGVNEFAARFVDALCGILTLVAVYILGRRIFDPLMGLLWALAFIGSFLPHFFFKSGVIDPLFNFFIFFGVAFCFFALRNSDHRHRLFFYALAGCATGLGMLTKGPVALLIVAMVMFVYWASVRFKVFFTFWDLIAFLVPAFCIASVFYGVETLFHGTWFIREFTKYQLRLLTTGDAGQGRPFYFHFLVVLFGCFPASFLAIRSFVKRDETVARQILFSRFMLILFWVVLILFSIVKTKTVLYSSLTYYPVTFLAALHMRGLIRGTLKWGKPLGYSMAIFALLIALAITFFPLLMINVHSIIPFVKDKFAVACLENPVHWSAWESLIGIAYATALATALFLLARQRFAAGFTTLLVSSALCLQCFMLIFAPKIEQYSQGGPVAFFREHSDGSCYVRSIFKSYTDLFYGKALPGPLSSSDKMWLLYGPIDKPAYFVSRVTEVRSGMPFDSLTELKREYGFVYFRREVPIKAVPAGPP
jgi:4-amino-4-deoxy-L-arabinose transferase-like glycosyltransferase